MKRLARSTFRKVYWLTLLLLLLSIPLASAAGRSAGSSAPLVYAVCGFLFWFLFGGRIALRLLPLFVSRIECPGCQEEIEPVGVWNCSCGFHDHKEHHILGKVCPKCGNRIGHIDCPRCDATILLW
jgi:hypothetical protein